MKAKRKAPPTDDDIVGDSMFMIEDVIGMEVDHMPIALARRVLQATHDHVCELLAKLPDPPEQPAP